MKTKKVYPNLQNVYYRPEFKNCLHCGAKLKRSHIAWRKTITSLDRVCRVHNTAYQCSNQANCEQGGRVYRSGYADGLSLPYYTYGLDVIVYIGQQRLRQHQTIPEIQRALQAREPMQISEREVEYLFDVYLLLSACSQEQRIEKKYRQMIMDNGGMVLAIDGAKPEKGQPGLYIFRDAVTGCRLHAAVLGSGDKDSIARELHQVKGYGLPVQAIVSDDEAATVAAVAEVFPDKLHGLCHTHFLKAAQRPVYKEDQKLARALKQPLRKLNKVVATVNNKPTVTALLSASQKEAITRYMDAFRALLWRKGQAPFRLSGVSIFESLSDLNASLTRSLSKQDHSLLQQLAQMSDCYRPHQATYQQVQRQQVYFLALADLLDCFQDGKPDWARQTGAEIAQEVEEFLTSLQILGDTLPEDAPFFAHLQQRVHHWAHGLYWTYEILALPRTNNALEVDIGNLKEQYRRITGRRCLKDYLMRYGPYLTFDDKDDEPEELLDWFQGVDYEDFRDERHKLEMSREQLRNIQRFNQNPEAFLADTERLWEEED